MSDLRDDSDRPGQSRTDFFRTERDAAYLDLVRAEAAFWDEAGTVVEDELPWGFQEYQNERLSGDPARRWYQTIGDSGEFERGLVLGAGPGNLESDLLTRLPDLHLTVCDISRDSLERQRVRLDAEFPGRVDFREDDLNFIALPPRRYDLIVALSSIHHVVNLEHVGFQINQALTGDGRFFMLETVGESYYQFSEEKKRIFEACLAATSHGKERHIRWPDRNDWEFSPFECVRSDEVLDVFRHYLHEVELRTANALLEPMIFLSPPGEGGHRSIFQRAFRRLRRELFTFQVKRRGPQRFAREEAEGQLFFTLDSYFSDSGALQPGLAFAIYRKRP